MVKKANNPQSVFDELGFDKDEADNLRIRSELMRIIARYIRTEKLTQIQAAKVFGITQPRVSDLIRGKVGLFTIDMLIILLNKIGIKVSLVTETIEKGAMPAMSPQVMSVNR